MTPEHKAQSRSNTVDLVLTRTFDAPIKDVWNAWTDADHLKKWWGSDGFSCPLAEMDVREDGTSFLAMSSPEYGDHYSTWEYHKIEPVKRIEFIHNLADEHGRKVDPVEQGMLPDFPQDQLQTVEFKAIGDDKTEMTVTEFEWTAGEIMEMARMGMEQCLDKMAQTFTHP